MFRFFKFRKCKKLSKLAGEFKQRYISPVHTAIIQGEKDILLEFIRFDSKCIEAPSEIGVTPLCCAISYNKQEMTELLLQNNANPNNPSRERHCLISPLIIAIVSRKKNFIELLLKVGADYTMEYDGISANKLLIQPQEHVKSVLGAAATQAAITSFIQDAPLLRKFIEEEILPKLAVSKMPSDDYKEKESIQQEHVLHKRPNS
jgi:hypothetical protein